MTNGRSCLWVAGVLITATNAWAAQYRILPSDADVLAGTTYSFSLEVETEPGDNTVGFGFFSFAIDLAVAGTAGATAFDISNVVIDETYFDDVSSYLLGDPQGNQYVGISGLTSDIFPPTFGQNPGEVIPILSFDFSIPVGALQGDTIRLTPSEGSLGNVIANSAFDAVSPQRFEPTSLTVVPEPASALLLLLGGALGLRRSPRRKRAS